MINENDLDLMLLAGMPIEIVGTGTIHPPKLKDIIAIGESRYNHLLSALLFDKRNIEGLADYEQHNNLQVLFAICYHDQIFRETLMKAFEYIFQEKAQLGYDDSEVFFYFGDIAENRKIDSDKLEFIQHVVRKMSFIASSKGQDYDPANSKAKQMIDMILRNKKKRPQIKETMNFHSIISGMAWKSKDMNILNIFDLTVYQLYQGFRVIENIDNHHFTLTGIYTGNIDSKNINLAKLHWAKILENN